MRVWLNLRAWPILQTVAGVWLSVLVWRYVTPWAVLLVLIASLHVETN